MPRPGLTHEIAPVEIIRSKRRSAIVRGPSRLTSDNDALVYASPDISTQSCSCVGPGAAPAGLKGQVAAALEAVAPHSEAAAANLAFALLSADGVPRDVARARALLEPLVTPSKAGLRGYVHNWLGHIASGKFGGRSKPAAALPHFEQAAMAGHSEAAFKAGLMHAREQACRLRRAGPVTSTAAAQSSATCRA